MRVATELSLALLIAAAGVVARFVLPRRRGPDAAARADYPCGRWPTRAVTLVLLLALAALALTSIVGLVRFGQFRGWLLLTHVLVSPVFLICLALWALLLAARRNAAPATARRDGLTAAGDALLLVGGAACVLSILFVTLPTVGYTLQPKALAVHHYAGLALVVGAIWKVVAVLLLRAR